MIDPWHGTHDDKPEGHGCLPVVLLAAALWAPVVYAAVWVWSRVR